jgi:hypothetical protein
MASIRYMERGGTRDGPSGINRDCRPAMGSIRYIVAGLAVALALAVSILLIVRNLPGGSPVPPQEQEQQQEPQPREEQQETASREEPSDILPLPEKPVSAPPSAVSPPFSVPPPVAPPSAAFPPPAPPSAIPGATPEILFTPKPLPAPELIAPTVPPLATPQVAAPGNNGRTDGKGRGGARLNPTAEQTAKLRYVLLSHSIMQSEAPEFPLRIGGTVPPEVALTPLPHEVADVIPGYMNYSYVITQNQIVIVITNRREIDLLIPIPT